MQLGRRNSTYDIKRLPNLVMFGLNETFNPKL